MSRATFIHYLESNNPLKGQENVSLVQVYKKIILKEKTIYNILNSFKVHRSLLVGLIWIPSKMETEFKELKNKIAQEKRLNVQVSIRECDKELTPPTYFDNN